MARKKIIQPTNAKMDCFGLSQIIIPEAVAALVKAKTVKVNFCVCLFIFLTPSEI